VHIVWCEGLLAASNVRGQLRCLRSIGPCCHSCTVAALISEHGMSTANDLTLGIRSSSMFVAYIRF
jgi:hypothetical protein